MQRPAEDYPEEVLVLGASIRAVYTVNRGKDTDFSGAALSTAAREWHPRENGGAQADGEPKLSPKTMDKELAMMLVECHRLFAGVFSPVPRKESGEEV